MSNVKKEQPNRPSEPIHIPEDPREPVRLNIDPGTFLLVIVAALLVPFLLVGFFSH